MRVEDSDRSLDDAPGMPVHPKGEEQQMYIGIGTVVLIVIIALIIFLLRR